MDFEYRIRYARPDDIDTILEMIRGDTFEPLEGKESRGTLIPLEREDVEPIVDRQHFFVAYLPRTGEIIGCASYVQRDSSGEGRSIYVKNPYRGNGVARNLIGHVIREAYQVADEIGRHLRVLARYGDLFEDMNFKEVIEFRRVHAGEMPRGYDLNDKIFADCNRCPLKGPACPETLFVYNLIRELHPRYL